MADLSPREALARLIADAQCATCPHPDEPPREADYRAADAVLAAGWRPAPTEPTKLAVVGEWLCEVVNEHTCAGGTPEANGAHEPTCGLEPVVKLADIEGWPPLIPDPGALLDLSEALGPHILAAAHQCLPGPAKALMAEEDLDAMADTAARMAYAAGVRVAPAVTEEQIEAGAKALFGIIHETPPAGPRAPETWETTHERTRTRYRSEAHIILSAARTPTPHSVPVDVTPGARGEAMLADPVGYLEAAREAAGGEGR